MSDSPTPTRADGQWVEVRTYDGDLVRKVSIEIANKLTEPGSLADWTPSHVQLKLGIRWIPPRDAKKASGRPERDDMDPAIWRGSNDPHIGRGALGKTAVDRAVTTRIVRRDDQDGARLEI